MEEEDDYSTPKGEELLKELVWRNGQVVIETQRRSKKSLFPEIQVNLEEQQLYAQEDEMANKNQYSANKNQFSLDDVYADLMCPDPPAIPTVTPPRVVPEFRPPPVTKPDDAPRRQNFVHFSMLPTKMRTEKALESTAAQPEARVWNGEQSNACIGSSAVGACEGIVASSSTGGSYSSEEGRQPQLRRSPDLKRRAKEIEDDGNQSEDFDFDVVEVKKQKSSKRSRAAEVHNQSERRRRDRINEKMKALQELIPRCTKSDKASMLDEAIIYLKSLQLQVQVMSLMMYPGMQQQYMPAAAMGLGTQPIMPFPPMANPRFMVMPTRNGQVPVGSEASFHQYQNQAAPSKQSRNFHQYQNQAPSKQSRNFHQYPNQAAGSKQARNPHQYPNQAAGSKQARNPQHNM